MLQIDKELKTNQISKYHLIYGEERYMVRYYKNKLIRKLSQPGDEMNCVLFQNKTISTSDVAEAGQILPFFAEHRLLVVEDSFFFNNSCDMLDYIKEFPETTYVVFVERKVDKRNRLFKWINQNGCVTECAYQSERMLRQWINGYVKMADKIISPSALELLIERVGVDMESLSNELEKCIGYVGERETIEREDVDIISTGVAVSKIFEMIDAVAEKDENRALRLYGDLLANKESPMSILNLFSRHINILLRMKNCIRQNIGRADIARKCDIPPFTVVKYKDQAALFTEDQLYDLLDARLDYEEEFKVGKLSDQLAVEMFLIQALTK